MLRLAAVAILISFSASAGDFPLAEFYGTLKSITNKQIMVVKGEDQVLVFHRDRKTKFYAGGREVRDDQMPLKSEVRVEAKPTAWGDPEAINVIANTAKKK